MSKRKSKLDVHKPEIEADAKNMTIPELARKYNVSTTLMRYYLIKKLNIEPKKQYQRTNTAMIEQIKEDCKIMGYKELALKYGYGEKSMSSILCKHHITQYRDEYIKNKIVRHMQSNPDMSLCQAAKELGCSTTKLNGDIKKFGLQNQYKKSNHYEKQILQKQVETMTIQEIADYYGKDTQYMYSIFRKYKIDRSKLQKA